MPAGRRRAPGSPGPCRQPVPLHRLHRVSCAPCALVIDARRARGIGPRDLKARSLGPVGAATAAPSVAPAVAPREPHAAATAGAPMLELPPADTASPSHPLTASRRVSRSIIRRTMSSRCSAARRGRLPAACRGRRSHDDRATTRSKARSAFVSDLIGAVFHGTARLQRDEVRRSGRIIGAGAEAGRRSLTQGVISYRVLEGSSPASSRVELEVGYTLSGALAQFSRPGPGPECRAADRLALRRQSAEQARRRARCAFHTGH